MLPEIELTLQEEIAYSLQKEAKRIIDASFNNEKITISFSKMHEYSDKYEQLIIKSFRELFGIPFDIDKLYSNPL